MRRACSDSRAPRAKASRSSRRSSHVKVAPFPFVLLDEQQAQLLQAEPDARLHGAQRLVQAAGDPLRVVAPEVGELNGKPLLNRQSRQRLLDDHALLAEDGGVGAVRGARRGEELLAGQTGRRFVAEAATAAGPRVAAAVSGRAG